MYPHLKNKPVIFMFSAGKDSIVSADIFRLQHGGPVHWVYLYFVKGISFVDSIIRHYEQRWGIKIHQRMCHEMRSIIARRDPKNRKRHFLPGEIERELKLEFECEWIVDGMKRNDSLARRGMLKNCDGTIDWSGKKIHPIIDWKDRQVNAYLKINRLPVPVTYGMGPRRSIWTVTAPMMPWMNEHFPDDYELILSEVPEIGDALFQKGDI